MQLGKTYSSAQRNIGQLVGVVQLFNPFSDHAARVAEHNASIERSTMLMRRHRVSKQLLALDGYDLHHSIDQPIQEEVGGDRRQQNSLFKSA